MKATKSQVDVLKVVLGQEDFKVLHTSKGERSVRHDKATDQLIKLRCLVKEEGKTLKITAKGIALLNVSQ